MRAFRSLASTSLTLTVACLGAAVAFRAAPEARQQMIPATAGSLLVTPETYIGETVSIMAPVDRVLSPTLLVVDQKAGESTGQDVLVIVPTLQKTPDVDAYVTIIGSVFAFDTAELAKRAPSYALDVPAEALSAFAGKPAILVANLYDPAMEDLAKVPPPPITPEEEAFDGVMKQVSNANGAIRKAIEGQSATLARESAATLRTAFDEAGTFFTGRNNEEATTWAREARDLAAAIVEAVDAGNWESAGQSMSELGQKCSSCHAAYRVRLDDGSYRVKWEGGA